MKDKSKVINGALWLALALAMAASIQHLAWTFGTVERPDHEWLGWIPAVAVDAGLAALAYTIQQRKRVNKPTGLLWLGVVSFAIISALANLYHALAVEGVELANLYIVYGKAFALSATLPAMYIFLGEIVSGDDANLAADIQRKADREAAKAEREANREDMKTKAALLQAENEQKRLAMEAAKAEQSEPAAGEVSLACGDCDFVAKSQNALNAHKRKHTDAPLDPPVITLAGGSNGKTH